MPYELKGGEELRGGKLYGWTGAKCKTCKGCGQEFNRHQNEIACQSCGGTGDDWGLMPVQPELS